MPPEVGGVATRPNTTFERNRPLTLRLSGAKCFLHVLQDYVMLTQAKDHEFGIT